MKKILFVTTAYILKGSSAAIRNNSLVKGLVDLGYVVDVFTVQWPEYLSSPFFEKEQNGCIHYERLPNLVRIARIKQAKIQNGNSKWLLKIRQFLKKVVFFPDECYEWRKDFLNVNLEQYTCLISSSDHKTSHFVGLNLKRRFSSLPWIQIWGDPWSSDVNTLPIMKGLTAFYEKKLLNVADKIVYVSGVTKNEMQMKYPMLGKKMYNIPRGYYFELDTQPRLQGKVRIVYTGVLSYGRDPFALLSVLAKLNSPKYMVDFYGNIPYEMQEKLSNFSFVQLHESVDFEYMPNVLTSASILLYLSNRKGSSQIPGKFFDYMGTNKPILCLVSDEADSTSLFLKQFERCLVLNNSESTITDNWSKIEEYCSLRFKPETDFSPKHIAASVMNLLS